MVTAGRNLCFRQIYNWPDSPHLAFPTVAPAALLLGKKFPLITGFASLQDGMGAMRIGDLYISMPKPCWIIRLHSFDSVIVDNHMSRMEELV